MMMLTAGWFPEDDAQTKEFKREVLRLALSVFALTCGEGAEKDKDEVIAEVRVGTLRAHGSRLRQG